MRAEGGIAVSLVSKKSGQRGERGCGENGRRGESSFQGQETGESLAGLRRCRKDMAKRMRGYNK